MRFRFCGDLDCPDWVLAEIATISKISSIKAKQLCSLIAQSLINKEILQNERITKLATDTKLEVNDIKACIALIEFILTSAAKHYCNSETLNSELQQLGLPKEHSTAICKVYDDCDKKLEEMLRNSSLTRNAYHFSCKSSLKLISGLLLVNKLSSLVWRIDYIYGSSHLNNINQPLANLKLQIKDAVDNDIHSHVVTLDSKNLKLLIYELKEARKLMESLN